MTLRLKPVWKHIDKNMCFPLPKMCEALYSQPVWKELHSIPMNLLIVEDNARMRQMIKNIVSDLVDEITECADGEDALALFSAKKPDWVLMDIQMKNINGLAATQQILGQFRDAKIVIVTNYNDPKFRESAKEAGAIGYVLKENLLDIRQILQGI